jgi:hypothetical protein
MLKVKDKDKARHRWLTPIILATQEAEIRRIEIQIHTGQIVREALSQKKKTNPKKPHKPIMKKDCWSGSKSRP